MSFQNRVGEWMHACFGPAISCDKVERNFRFLEEALELVQALGCSRDEALALVDYVWSRPAGQPRQEVGGVMVTLAALCNAQDHRTRMDECGSDELERCYQKIEKIRAKHAAKPVGIRMALPGDPDHNPAKAGGG